MSTGQQGRIHVRGAVREIALLLHEYQDSYTLWIFVFKPLFYNVHPPIKVLGPRPESAGRGAHPADLKPPRCTHSSWH